MKQFVEGLRGEALPGLDKLFRTVFALEHAIPYFMVLITTGVLWDTPRIRFDCSQIPQGDISTCCSSDTLLITLHTGVAIRGDKEVDDCVAWCGHDRQKDARRARMRNRTRIHPASWPRTCRSYLGWIQTSHHCRIALSVLMARHQP